MSNQVWSNSLGTYSQQYVAGSTTVSSLFSPAVALPLKWSTNGTFCRLYIGGCSGTAAASVSVAPWTAPSGMPLPVTTQQIPVIVNSNTASVLGIVLIASNGSCSFATGSGWTSGQPVGIIPQVIEYFLL
jgi:hypothetical protein